MKFKIPYASMSVLNIFGKHLFAQGGGEGRIRHISASIHLSVVTRVMLYQEWQIHHLKNNY